MESSRRSFFGMLAVPLVAKLLPDALVGPIGITGPTGSLGPSGPELFFDQINVVTRECLARNPLPDILFQQSPLSALMMKKERILDAGGSIVGQFGRIPGQPWERISGGLRYPVALPRLPV